MRIWLKTCANESMFRNVSSSSNRKGNQKGRLTARLPNQWGGGQFFCCLLVSVFILGEVKCRGGVLTFAFFKSLRGATITSDMLKTTQPTATETLLKARLTLRGAHLLEDCAFRGGGQQKTPKLKFTNEVFWFREWPARPRGEPTAETLLGTVRCLPACWHD